MGFIFILVLVTLAVASSAAFFSIYGLAQIFAGSFWAVVIMASSLEAGKLVAASYVYRYRDKISFLMKSYLIIAVIILMIITSAGIFGFLSSAHQADIMPIQQMDQRIELLATEKAELDELKQERLDRKKQIDVDIASLPNNYITGRQRLMKSYGGELEQLKQDISSYTIRAREITLEVSELKHTKLQEQAHVGPIIFIARVFDRPVDDATKWLILMIIFAFDPLAVILTVGINIALMHRKLEKQEHENKIQLEETVYNAAHDAIEEVIKEEHLVSPTVVDIPVVEPEVVEPEVVEPEVVEPEVVEPEVVEPEVVEPEVVEEIAEDITDESEVVDQLVDKAKEIVSGETGVDPSDIGITKRQLRNAIHLYPSHGLTKNQIEEKSVLEELLSKL